MTAKLVYENRFILVEGMTPIESANLKLAFTKKYDNWFIIKKKNPMAVVEESFMTSQGVIPSGLWMELVAACQRFGYSIDFIDDFDEKIRKDDFSRDDFMSFVDDMFKDSGDFKPRQYQLDACMSVLEYGHCAEEISTSGGKTLICYILFRYFKYHLHLRKLLYITPSTSLTTQTTDKFHEYDERLGLVSDWKFAEIFADSKRGEKDGSEDITVGNFQSLCKKKPEYFQKYDIVVNDECHHNAAKSLKNIIRRLGNVKYNIGLTGTFPPIGSYDSFVIQSYIGPLVYRFSSYSLINEEHAATPVVIVGLLLDYLDKDTKSALFQKRLNKNREDPRAGANLLDEERDIVRKDRGRFLFVCDLISKTTKNTLVLFRDVMNSYGQDIYEYVKKYSDKNVYYIDGSTPAETRNYAKVQMENDLSGNTIIVASIGCFSEGIDISNLWNIILAESVKSDIVMNQIIGRGMRKFEGKAQTTFIDIGDDFHYGKGYYGDNYLLRHFNQRGDIYANRGFPYSIIHKKL